MRSPRRHPSRAPGTAAIVQALVLPLLVLALGCGPQAGGGGTVTPGGAGGGVSSDPDGRDEGQSAGELKQRLDALLDREEQLAPQAATDAGKCEDLCELATSICAVEEKLCDLADDHPDDDAYQGLCREARNECREAQDSCVRCVERLGARSTQPQ
ncbi:MAG: hypothetical protein IPH07_14660 [Deltaproteobacteria bacterium]|jgi:hypothetical protein|nr:hypothetical protein [Deltaproteobacteria bacterium]MBK8239018.1 hypothetical protein [Deltaproteobacteria bacterium]MBK8717532.1 hypothetical protein [Deltaproteobacteria bacterium]MBP7285861.1 hypothetical protein [Nannocystaceae bacterium]